MFMFNFKLIPNYFITKVDYFFIIHHNLINIISTNLYFYNVF